MVTERGSEYNIVERENSRKLTASGKGGVITTLQSPWGRGRGEKRIRQILLDTMKTVPPPLFPGDKE